MSLNVSKIIDKTVMHQRKKSPYRIRETVIRIRCWHLTNSMLLNWSKLKYKMKKSDICKLFFSPHSFILSNFVRRKMSVCMSVLVMVGFVIFYLFDSVVYSQKFYRFVFEKFITIMCNVKVFIIIYLPWLRVHT